MKAFRCNAGSLGELYLATSFFSFYPMFSRTLFTAGLLAGMLPLASYAQTAPRFYVGAGANLLTSVPFLSEGAAARVYGPALTAGLQLNPRLALQAGVAYFWQNRSFSDAHIDPNQADPVVNKADFHSKYFVIPVLLRYTFAPSTQRFHVDALAGVTLTHHSYRNSSSSNSLYYPYSYEYSGSTTNGSLTLGPAVRYTLVPNVELTANALVSATVGDDYYRFSDRLFLNVLVGAHYTFGQR
jgi:hypothetical protein